MTQRQYPERRRNGLDRISGRPTFSREIRCGREALRRRRRIARSGRPHRQLVAQRARGLRHQRRSETASRRIADPRPMKPKRVQLSRAQRLAHAAGHGEDRPDHEMGQSVRHRTKTARARNASRSIGASSPARRPRHAQMCSPRAAFVAGHVDELKGKNLACWCPLDGPCHGGCLARTGQSLSGS